MLCQNCKKREATVNHIQSINGAACAVHLCAACADSLFGEFEKSFFGGMQAGLFDEPVFEERQCPSCGLRFSEYRQTGLLGCPSCYDVFNEELMPYITRIQGKTVHVGKGGGVNTSEHELLLKLSALQKAMEKALSCGDYVKAGEINEQMNALKKRAPRGWRW